MVLDAVLGVVQRRRDGLARAVVVVREALASAVAGAAADGAALAKPEAGLPVGALRGAVGAGAGVRLDLPGRRMLPVCPAGRVGVHGIPRRRHDHGAVRARKRKKHGGNSHHHRATSEPCLRS